MTFPLRWRLLVLAGLLPAMLALGTYVYLSRVVRSQVRSDIDQSLDRAALVVERQFSERLQSQAVAARVIARDPTFYAAVALPGGAGDPTVRNTVRGVALDFQKLAHADVFEVWDRRGRVLASVGDFASGADDRARLMRDRLRAREFTGMLIAARSHWQVAYVPVRADGAVVGALLLGSAIDASLAHELHRLTRGDVTFVSAGAVTGSSLADREDVGAALAAVRRGAVDSHPAPFETPGRAGGWVMLARPLPGTPARDGQSFVIQRSLGEEMALLRSAEQGLLALALAVLLITATLSIVTAERITRPILALVRVAEAMERGDYDTPIEADTRDEVGYLATRFREMRLRQKDYVTGLEEVARHKSDFIALTSHELGTPVAVIKGYLELLDQSAPGESPSLYRQALTAMNDSVERLEQLTARAALMAEIESERLVLNRSDYEVGALVDQAVEVTTRSAAGRRIKVERSVPADGALAYVDGPRIVQALAHLVHNAIRFTPDGGRVEVRARVDHDGWVLAVVDTGVGMTPEKLRQALSRSFVVNDVMHHHSSNQAQFGSAGLGLGLAIVRGIVEAHGGSIQAESTPQAGSVISLHIPRVDAERKLAA